jgi:tetratricopeptide (TPR) repeat protein
MDYYQQGVKLTRQKDYDGAIDVFNTGLEEYPDDYGILDRRAVAYHYKGEIEKALADYTRMIALNPQNPDGWDNRGNLYHELGEYDKAIADFTQCIPLSPPNYGRYWSNRGLAYYDKGDLDAALADFTTSIELWGKPGLSVWALVRRGIVWRKKGDLDKALAHFELAASYDPEDDDPLYNAGYIHFMKEDYDKAIDWFSKTLAVKDDETDYWMARGVCYWNKCSKEGIGFWSEEGAIMDLAEKDFTKAIECAPENSEAYFNRGLVHCTKAQESHNLLKRIVSKKAADEAKRVLALSQLDNVGGKEFVPTVDALFRGFRSARDKIDVGMAKGAGLTTKYHAGRAVEDLSRAIELDEDNAEAYYQRGLAYALRGAKDEALADCERACDLDPRHRKAAEKRDQLLKAENK